MAQKLSVKMLVKLIQGVNFTKILRAAFAPIFLHQKNTNLECKYKKKLCTKLLYEKAARKMLMKFSPEIYIINIERAIDL